MYSLRSSTSTSSTSTSDSLLSCCGRSVSMSSGDEAKGSESESMDIETRAWDLEVEGLGGLERVGSVVSRDA